MASSLPSSPEVSTSEAQPVFSYKTATQDEVLEDLSRWNNVWFHGISKLTVSCSRFILNLPEEEFESLERLCFQVEQAYVGTMDHLQTTSEPSLSGIGSMKTLSESRIQDFHRFHSRSSPRCCFVPVHFFTISVTTTNEPSASLCSIRPEYLSAELSC